MVHYNTLCQKHTLVKSSHRISMQTAVGLHGNSLQYGVLLTADAKDNIKRYLNSLGIAPSLLTCESLIRATIRKTLVPVCRRQGCILKQKTNNRIVVLRVLHLPAMLCKIIGYQPLTIKVSQCFHAAFHLINQRNKKKTTNQQNPRVFVMQVSKCKLARTR